MALPRFGMQTRKLKLRLWASEKEPKHAINQSFQQFVSGIRLILAA